MGKFIILGHRGQGPTSRSYQGKELPSGVIPENSLSAFRQAIADGADGFELDVFLTGDMQVIVSHDNEIDRNVNGHYNNWASTDVPEFGRISEKTLEEVRTYDIGGGERMPTLQEVINMAFSSEKSSSLNINIEIKGDGDIVPKTYAIMKQSVEEGKCSWDDFMINSFDPKALELIHQIHRDEMISKGESHPLKIAMGLYTWHIYGAKDDLGDFWLPVVRKSSPNGIVSLDTLGNPILKKEIDVDFFEAAVVRAKEIGCTAMDVVSSDLTDMLMIICQKHSMALAVATNAVRARAQHEILCPPLQYEKKTDEEIEQQEIRKIFELGQKYPKVEIYYKADKPSAAVKFRDVLQAEAIKPVLNLDTFAANSSGAAASSAAFCMKHSSTLSYFSPKPHEKEKACQESEIANEELSDKGTAPLAHKL